MNIKIGTFNIQSGVDRKYYLETKTVRRDVSLAANAIRELGLDICGLNEINNEEMVGGIHEPKKIAEQLGYHYAFAKALAYPNYERDYGNALVSRYPILSTKCVPIHLPVEQRIQGRGRYEDRVILCAEILVEGKIFTVMCAHFGLYEDEIALAVDIVRECVKNCHTPLLVLGDFNLTPESQPYSHLCEFLTDTALLLNANKNTFPSEAPTKRIDYIFKNADVKVLTGCVPELVVSDHRPYVITVDI